MEWYEAFILAFVQGLTEFLPVSSSGHLIIGKELLGVEAADDLVFEVLVHAATVLSTIVVFRKQLWELVRGFFRFRYNDETDYVLKICVSMIPVFIVGMFFKDFVEGLFQSIIVVGVALMCTAVLLFLSDMASGSLFRKQGRPGDAGTAPENGIRTSGGGAAARKVSLSERKGYRNGISYWQAFVVGLGQALAVVPGLSRSGTTISTGLLCGVRRDVMAQFSFLMVMIPILGESFLQVVGGEMTGSSIGVLPLVLGFVSAFVSGLFACKVMIALVKRARLTWFAVYCAVVAALIFIFN